MKLKIFTLALAGSMAVLPAFANAGCLKGAAVGGVAGHVAGHHGVLGAAAGCAIAKHREHKQVKAQQRADVNVHKAHWWSR